MKKLLSTAVLAALLPLTAHAGMFKAETPSEDKLKVRAADSIGLEPAEITIADVVQDGPLTRFKATLADGTTYRCSVEGTSGIVRFASWGQADASEASCTKRPGSGKGPEGRKAENALERAAKRH